MAMPVQPEPLLFREAAVAKADGSGIQGTVLFRGAREVAEATKRLATSGLEVVANPFAASSPSGPGGTSSVHERVLAELLKTPATSWVPPEPGAAFFLSSAEIIELCDRAEAIFRQEPNLLRLRAPTKIFGDIHGQFRDLCKLFNCFGAPSYASGDLMMTDYLFLGDYVDRGRHQLEVMCLLLALKIAHPYKVFLIRGNHEDVSVNQARKDSPVGLFPTSCTLPLSQKEEMYGFRNVCERHWPSSNPKAESGSNPVFDRFNALFTWLPLAAIIEAAPEQPCVQALPQCVNGGGGGSGVQARAVSVGSGTGKEKGKDGGGVFGAFRVRLGAKDKDAHAPPTAAAAVGSSSAAPPPVPPHATPLRRIYCVHGGIGVIKKTSQLATDVARPLPLVRPTFEESTRPQPLGRQLADDALWSDPAATDNDGQFAYAENGVLPSSRFLGVRFAPSVVRTFLAENGISAIVRAHQTADRGVELFAGGLGVTVFSAADYPEDRDAEDRAGNWAAVLQVGRDGVMYPRLLPPGPRPPDREEAD